MAKPIVNYDEISDTLYISFEPGKKATGIELNDHILLRINTDYTASPTADCCGIELNSERKFRFKVGSKRR